MGSLEDLCGSKRLVSNGFSEPLELGLDTECCVGLFICKECIRHFGKLNSNFFFQRRLRQRCPPLCRYRRPEKRVERVRGWGQGAKESTYPNP